jgi:hypothetical protein
MQTNLDLDLWRQARNSSAVEIGNLQCSASMIEQKTTFESASTSRDWKKETPSKPNPYLYVPLPHQNKQKSKANLIKQKYSYYE